MADIVQVDVARNEVFIPKTTVGPDRLRGETVSSATATIGTSVDPTENTAIDSGNIAVESPDVYVTIEADDWPETGEIAYVGVLIVLSDGRKIARRYDCTMLW